MRADFHMTFLWLRAVEILIGAAAQPGELDAASMLRTELDESGLFDRYRPVWKA